jgi:hypothetical protein
MIHAFGILLFVAVLPTETSFLTHSSSTAVPRYVASLLFRMLLHDDLLGSRRGESCQRSRPRGRGDQSLNKKDDVCFDSFLFALEFD